MSRESGATTEVCEAPAAARRRAYKFLHGLIPEWLGPDGVDGRKL